jgi:dihydropteroate synthase
VSGYRLMGVVNVTPDSFSDGGAFVGPEQAVAHSLELVRQGADILDIGGESTRPGAEPVGASEEITRVQPVLAGLSAAGVGVQLSIDTSKRAVAEVALREGATLVNDVTAFRGDPGMAELVAEAGVECCLMHMLGEPRTMQREGGPKYRDVVSEVKSFLEERMAFAVREGVAEERILLDPGIGFGKTAEHNLELLRRLGELVAVGRPLVVGTSRKTFLGRVAAAAAQGAEIDEVEPLPTDERLPGTIATNVLAYERGASVFRVHDVAAVRDALAVTAATLGARWTQSSAGTTARRSTTT